MKYNQWTLALAAAGVVSLGSVAQAEEAQHQVLTALSSTTLSGYVDTSAIWQLGTGKTSVGRSYDAADKQDGFNLNHISLGLSKGLEEGQWSAGYNVQMLFGPDANTYASTSSGANFSDFAVKQAYIDMLIPVGTGLDVQMGVFDTCIGYEVFDSAKGGVASNWNYSRSYAYSIEPLSHTGILAKYKLTDWMNAAFGVANTSSQVINARPTRNNGGSAAAESKKTYMGLVTLTAPESLGFLKDSTLNAGIVHGIDNTWDAVDTTSYYVGGTFRTPVTGLTLGAAYDYRGRGQETAQAVVAANRASDYANAISLYAKYQATEKLSFASRSEYATASDGTWYNNVRAGTAGAHYNNELFGQTLTVDYKLFANVITRAEVRWDHDMTGQPTNLIGTANGGGIFGTDAITPGDNASNRSFRNAYSLALNVIYSF